MWFHKDTRTVLSIGTPPTGVPSNQIAELDVIYTKKGKTLAVGDVFDWDKVESVDEIKTTIKGTMPDDQKQKYRAILGNDRFRMQNTTRRFTDAAGWHDNSKGLRSRGIQRMLIGASAVTTILAVSYPAEAEDERDAMLSAYIHLKNNFNHPAEGPAAAYDFGVALSQYLTVTTGEDQSGKIVAICVYAQLYFQDSQPEEEE